MSLVYSPPPELAARPDYLRQRFSPGPGDCFYLPLSDLRLALATVASDEPLTILDFGADLAPYRTLFPASDYRLADIDSPAAADYRIAADGTVPERAGFFDFILSTQVAEHLPDPFWAVYFAECFRLLKPGGVLFLTTHGAYEDHGCPHDYQRWTADGLRRDLLTAGFVDVALSKLTTGPRAVLFQFERCLETTWLPRRRLSGLLLWMMRYGVRLTRPLLHRIADSWYADHRLVSADRPQHINYVGLAAHATRPSK